MSNGVRHLLYEMETDPCSITKIPRGNGCSSFHREDFSASLEMTKYFFLLNLNYIFTNFRTIFPSPVLTTIQYNPAGKSSTIILFILLEYCLYKIPFAS